MCKRILLVLLILVPLSIVPVNIAGAATGMPDQFKISIPSQSHTDYGLAYPVTYMFNVPSEGITVWHRHNSDADWKAVPEKTAEDYFNGIEAVRFDEGTAYVSVAFDAGSDDIYLSFADGSDDPVEGVTYAGISEYYDNRKAVVTMTNDDYGSDARLASFQAMWEATGSRKIWSTSAAMTTPTTANNQWDELQAAVDGGYVEVASHTQTHPLPDTLPYGDEIEASKQDIIDNLRLPPLYSNGDLEYVPLFIAPHLALTSDDLTGCATSKYLAIISIQLGTREPGWGTWNDTEGIYNPKYVSKNYEDVTIAELNDRFDERYAAGDIYHLRGHPDVEMAQEQDTWTSGKMADHLDYIKGKTDIWYVGYGAMYMYHYVQERGLVTVTPGFPTVTGITPDSGTIEDNALSVTVTGTGFENDSGLALELNNDGTDSIDATSLTWVNSTQIDATFDLTGVTSNLGGTWDIKVINPDGQAGTGSNLFTIFTSPHNLTIVISGNGSASPSAGTHTYNEGTVVDIMASPESGWQFVNWTGDVADPNSASTTVTIDGDKTLTANFELEDNILAQQTISPDNPVTVNSKDDQIVIEFPANSVVGEAVVTIKGDSIDTPCPSGFKAGDTCFNIGLTEILFPGKMVLITVKYSSADLEACDGNPDKLKLARYDEDTGKWVIVDTTVDTEAMALAVSTDQLSTWMIMVEKGQNSSMWIWLISIFGGLTVLLAIGGVIIVKRRRMTS